MTFFGAVAPKLLREFKAVLISRASKILSVIAGSILCISARESSSRELFCFSASFTILPLILCASRNGLSSFFTNQSAKSIALEFEFLAKNSNSNAIDLADWLVKKLDKPFREAHSISGKMVKLAEKQNSSLEELSLADMQSIEPAITESIFDALDINTALNSRNSFGATAPKNVMEACTQARHKYLK